MRNPIPAAFLIFLAAGASPADAQAPSASDSQRPSVSLPPDLDHVLRDYERAWKSADASNVAALFSVDGFVLQNGRAPVRGGKWEIFSDMDNSNQQRRQAAPSSPPAP